MSTVDPAAVPPSPATSSPTTSSNTVSATFTPHSSAPSEQAMSLVVQLGATACSNNMISSQQASPLPATAVTSPDKPNQYPTSADLGLTSDSKDVTTPAATIVVTNPFQNILKKSPLIISNNSTALPAKIHTINTSNGQQRLQTLNVQRTSVGATATPSTVTVATAQLTHLGTQSKVQVLSNVVIPKNHYIINKNVVNPSTSNPQRQILNHVNTKHIVTNAVTPQKTALNILTSKVAGGTTTTVPTNSKPQLLNNMVVSAPKTNYITATTVQTGSNQLLNNGTTRTTIVNNAKVVPQAHVISRVISTNSAKPPQTSPTTNNQFLKNSSTIVVQKNTHPSSTSSTPTTVTTSSKTNSTGIIKTLPSMINHLQKLQNTANRMSNNMVVQQRTGIKTIPPQRPVASISTASSTFTKTTSKPSAIKGNSNSVKTSHSTSVNNNSIVSREHLLSSPKSKQVIQINQTPSPVPAGTRLVTTQSGNVLTTGNVLKYQGQQFQVIHAPSPPNFVSAQLSPQIQVATNQNVQPMTVVRTVASYEDNNVPVGIASDLFSPNNNLSMISKDRTDLEISQDHHYLSEEDIISEVRPDYSSCTNPVLFDHNYHLPPPDSPPPSPKKSSILESVSNVNSNSSQISPNYIFAKSPGRLNLTNSLSGSHLDLLQEDDAASTISSDTGREVEPEGEETETAPEGEGEEDSVTRCICEFEHDDGYMICCDKCFVWQHVDCMFIDWQNIQEEYLCEKCEPRRVDRQRARAIQLRKREELLNTGSSSDTSSGSSTVELANAANQTVANPKKRQPPPAPSVGRRKNADAFPQTTQKSRTNSTPGAATSTNATQRRSRRDSNRDPPPTGKAKLVNSATIKQRRQERKIPMKRKTKARRSQDGGNDDSQESWERGSSSASVNQLRSWIENYEEAVTNHYSPELRARIIKTGAHHHNSDSKSNNLHSMAQASANIHKCRTIQQATLGTKILVSTMLLSANTPIIELRGKYMLSSLASSGSGNANHHQNVVGRPHAQKPGPFLFFYRLQKDNVDVCVDTRTYGNDARFVRRSCKPNAEIRHCIEKGTLHLYLVSTSDIDKNTELTIKHDAATVPPITPCACGNPATCSVASPQPSQTRSNSTSSNPSSIVTRRSNGAVHDLVELSTQRKRRGRRTTSSSDVELPSPTPSASKTPTTIPPPPEPPTPPVTTQSATTTVQITQSTTTVNTSTTPTTTSTVTSTSTTSSNQTGPVRRRSQNSRAQVVTPSIPPPVKLEEKPELTVQINEQNDDSKDKKKMTREEKKLEAIMKAFERMEKQEQRKQESKTRQAHRRESDSISTPQYNSNDSNNSNERTKRKRRKGRARTTSTNSNSNSATNRRRARLNSTDSHLTSGDDNSLMSPPLPVNDEANITQIHSNDISINNNNISMNRMENGDNDTSDENQTDEKGEGDLGTEGRAADLLLALANGGHNNEDNLKSPVRDPDACSSAGSVNSSPGTLLSSNCLLVAAAVEQITPGFKFPKTKKAIMNEWLNKSPEPVQPASAISSMSLQAQRSLEFQSPLSVTTNSLESPSNNCRQTLASLMHATTICSTSPPTSKLTGGNAKKRWLRQAISEECDSPNSRPESPHAEMIAPPKKRRMARESSESFTPPTTPTRSNHPNINDDYENDHYMNNDEEYYSEDKVKSEFSEENNQKCMDLDSETYSNAFNGHDSSNQEPDQPSKELESEDVDRISRTEEFSTPPTSLLLDPRLRYENANCLGRVVESLQFLESWGCTPKAEAITPAKRKLSISEYRQRKQQVVSTSSNASVENSTKSTPSGSNSGSSTVQNVSDCSTGGSNSPRPSTRLRTNSASSGTSSLSSDDEQKDPVTTPVETPDKEKVPGLVAFDSTPTLVERERENLTARLKREFGLFLQDEEDSKKTTTSLTDGLLSHRLGLRSLNSFMNSSVPNALDEKTVNNIGLSTTSLDEISIKTENKIEPSYPNVTLSDSKSALSSFDSITSRSEISANNNTPLSNGAFKMPFVNFITPFDNPMYPNTTYYTGFPMGKSPYSSSLVTTSSEIDGVTGSKYSSPLNKLSSRK